MRPLWTGAIQFGLVTIPVRLYSAAPEAGLDLDMLHSKDRSPIRYARMCKEEEKEVPYDEIVKGYEYKGDYVVLTEDDFKKAHTEKTGSIEIHSFAKAAEIDSVYFEKPYYVEPEKQAAKSYALLREALEQSDMVGIATFVLHGREHVAALKTSDTAIILNQMRFADDLRGSGDLDLPKRSGLNDREVKMALSLIAELKAPFRPRDYRDTYTKELEELIKKKAQGRRIIAKAIRRRPTKTKDLMRLLKQSLAHHSSARSHASSRV